MSWSNKGSSQTVPWFWIGMIGLFLVSLGLRFWGLGRFNTLVFDEVYYAKFGNNYLTHTPFFDGHPPLSKYIIAFGMWLGSRMPFGQDAVNGLTGSLRSTWSYRWLDALTGSFIPLVVAGIAYQLSYRRSYAFIAGLFAAADGLFLVESRYALNNVYLVIFGLLGQWFFLRGLEQQGRKRAFWLTFAGIGFGASASVKWNGLWFLFGAYLIWAAVWVVRWLQAYRKNSVATPNPEPQTADSVLTPLQNLTQLNVLHILFFLGIVPALFYSIEWIPHLQLDRTYGFLEVQKQILSYHERVGGNSPKVHPYCSPWYTWFLMLRPVAYYYQTTQKLSDPLPVSGPPLPAGAGNVVYDVHAIGNPALWWLSTAAILILVFTLVQKAWVWITAKPAQPVTPQDTRLTQHNWIALYLVLNWLANWLPWAKVTRCTFLYHYMGAAVFAGLAIALLVNHWLQSYRPILRALGITVIFIILFAFVFWMPIYLGLPLSPEGYYLRMARLDLAKIPHWLSRWLPTWLNKVLPNWI